MMTADEILAKLKSKQNQRGIDQFKKINKNPGITSVGWDVEDVKKLAREAKRDHDRAMQLWKSPLYEAKLMSIFTDEPKKVTMEQVNEQLKRLSGVGMADYYAQDILIKTGFAKKIVQEWRHSENRTKKKIAFAILAYSGKAKKLKEWKDKELIDLFDQIGLQIRNEENPIKEAMNYALMYCGPKGKKTWRKAMEIAERTGRIDIEPGKSFSDTPDARAYLEKNQPS